MACVDFTKAQVSEAYLTLQRTYAFPYDLKPEQLSVICDLVNGVHSFVVLPTGYGKSDIFVLVPLILDVVRPQKKHKALVVVPLLSLMADMAVKYQQRRVRVVAATKQDKMSQADVRGIQDGEFSVILVSPELLVKNARWMDVFTQSANYKNSICLVAIDESHVLIEWGDTFRPCYKVLGELRSHIDDATFCALTATCSPSIKRKILEVIHLTDANTSTTAILPDRPNIKLKFIKKHPRDMEEALAWYLLELAEKKQQCPKVIVYCRNIRHTGHGYGMLSYAFQKMSGLSKSEVRSLIAEYHAELFDEKRQQITAEFRKQDSSIRCLISTVAFGMGIDIPDVHWIVHWGESNTVVQYWQEVGRCGRNGQPAEAITYHDGTQLQRCSEEMKSLVQNISQGLCIRKSVLTALHLPEMDPISKKNGCLANCCSVCDCTCDCQECKNKSKE